MQNLRSAVYRVGAPRIDRGQSGEMAADLAVDRVDHRWQVMHSLWASGLRIDGGDGLLPPAQQRFNVRAEITGAGAERRQSLGGVANPFGCLGDVRSGLPGLGRGCRGGG